MRGSRAQEGSIITRCNDDACHVSEYSTTHTHIAEGWRNPSPNAIQRVITHTQTHTLSS